MSLLDSIGIIAYTLTILWWAEYYTYSQKKQTLYILEYKWNFSLKWYSQENVSCI